MSIENSRTIAVISLSVTHIIQISLLLGLKKQDLIELIKDQWNENEEDFHKEILEIVSAWDISNVHKD